MDYLIKGTAASRGVARGRAKLVNGPGDNFVLARGDVLIARVPIPSLSPLLPKAAALVCAYGDPQSLLVSLAREYALPVVIGVGSAIEHVAEDTVLWVDGIGGTVSTFDPRGVWQVTIQQVVRVHRAEDSRPVRSAA